MAGQWHTGRTVGVTLYKGDGPADMVGVMVGPHDEACELAAVVVRAVNAANAAVRGTQAQESVSDEVAALTARLAAVEGERDRLRRELAEMDDVAGHVAAERDDADAARVAQDARWRALVGALLPHVRHAAGCDLALPACQCGALTAIARGLAAIADAPPAPRGAAE